VIARRFGTVLGWLSPLLLVAYMLMASAYAQTVEQVRPFNATGESSIIATVATDLISCPDGELTTIINRYIALMADNMALVTQADMERLREFRRMGECFVLAKQGERVRVVHVDSKMGSVVVQNVEGKVGWAYILDLSEARSARVRPRT
jgi:hypothetical protein